MENTTHPTVEAVELALKEYNAQVTLRGNSASTLDKKYKQALASAIASGQKDELVKRGIIKPEYPSNLIEAALIMARAELTQALEFTSIMRGSITGDSDFIELSVENALKEIKDAFSELAEWKKGLK